MSLKFIKLWFVNPALWLSFIEWLQNRRKMSFWVIFRKITNFIWYFISFLPVIPLFLSTLEIKSSRNHQILLLTQMNIIIIIVLHSTNLWFYATNKTGFPQLTVIIFFQEIHLHYTHKRTRNILLFLLTYRCFACLLYINN